MSRDTRYGVVREPDLRIPTGSETASGARYVAEDASEPQPVLLMSIPYRKDDHITYGAYDPIIRYLARHGYNVVVTDLVGTGASSGFKAKHQAFTGTEAVDVIDWLADQEWSTGRVGMFGKSYGGRTALTAAAQQPDALEAIVPITAPYSAYDDSKMQGGTLSFYKQAGDFCPLIQTLLTLPPSYRDDEGRWKEVWEERLDGMTESRPWLFEFLDHDHKDEFWQGKDVKVEDIEVPIFGISGWRDFYPHAVLEELEKVDAPTRILMGPWRHTIPHRGRETAVDFRPQVLEWFDHFLKDEDNGALEHPPIEYWTERDGGGQIEGGTWRALDRWPTAADPVDTTATFALTPGGLDRSERFDSGAVEADYEYDHTVGIDSIDYMSPPTDTSADDARSLTFETGRLEDAFEFTGTGSATVRLRPTTPDPLLAVRLVDVSPGGEASLVSYGRVRTSQRDSWTDPDPLTPGEEYEITVPLKPTSHVFEAGHRIRVAISAAYFPLMLSTRDQGSFTVLSDPDAPSVVRLPGTEHVGGVSFDDTIEMGSPDVDVVPTSSEYVTHSDGTWETAREHQGNSARFTKTSQRTLDLPHATMHWDRTIEGTTEATDPLATKIVQTADVTVDYGDCVVEVHTKSHAGHDTGYLTEEATIDGQPVFEHTWRR